MMSNKTRRLRVALAIVVAASCVPSVLSRGMSLVQPGQPETSGVVKNVGAPFSVSLVPVAPIPVRIGAQLGFQLSSGDCPKTC